MNITIAALIMAAVVAGLIVVLAIIRAFLIAHKDKGVIKKNLDLVNYLKTEMKKKGLTAKQITGLTKVLDQLNTFSKKAKGDNS